MSRSERSVEQEREPGIRERRDQVASDLDRQLRALELRQSEEPGRVFWSHAGLLLGSAFVLGVVVGAADSDSDEGERRSIPWRQGMKLLGWIPDF